VHEARVEAYKAHRLGEKKAGATVNRELAALRRAFRLGVKQKRISRAPEIEMLAEAPPREWSVRGWWRARSTRSARRALRTRSLSAGVGSVSWWAHWRCGAGRSWGRGLALGTRHADIR